MGKHQKPIRLHPSTLVSLCPKTDTHTHTNKNHFNSVTLAHNKVSQSQPGWSLAHANFTTHWARRGEQKIKKRRRLENPEREQRTHQYSSGTFFSSLLHPHCATGRIRSTRHEIWDFHSSSRSWQESVSLGGEKKEKNQGTNHLKH